MRGVLHGSSGLGAPSTLYYVPLALSRSLSRSVYFSLSFTHTITLSLPPLRRGSFTEALALLSLLGPVDPSFRALPGRLKCTVRRHKFWGSFTEALALVRDPPYLFFITLKPRVE